ncbi:MAG: hypothetical protein ABEJ56_02895 [Candidatus Nanohaloarchaea archaeon]
MGKKEMVSGYSQEQIDGVVMDATWNRYEEARNIAEELGIEVEEVENFNTYRDKHTVMEVEASMNVCLTPDDLSGVNIRSMLG